MISYIIAAILLTGWALILFAMPVVAFAIFIAVVSMAAISYFDSLQMKLHDIEYHLHQR